jgi:hypothetical protein
MEDLDLSIEALAIWKPILLQLNSNFPNFMDELTQTLLKEVTKNQGKFLFYLNSSTIN